MSFTPVPIGGDVQVNTYTINDQLEPSVAALAGGGFVVTWTSIGEDLSWYGVVAQRYAADGTPLGDSFIVNQYYDEEQWHSSAAGLADGGFVITFQTQDADGYGVLARRYAADGTPLTDEFVVNTYPFAEQGNASLTGLADGGFVVVWQSDTQDGGAPAATGVYGQRYDASGDPAGGEFHVSTETAEEQGYPAVAALGDGGFVVVWQSHLQDGESWGIYGQRYAADGSPVGGEFPINTTTASSQDQAAVAALAGGGFVVVWQSLNQDGHAHGIYGQRFAADGSTVGGEFQANTVWFADQVLPSITALEDGGFVVSWSSLLQDGAGWGVYGQRYGADGAAVGDEFRINQITEGTQVANTTTGTQNLATLADGTLVQVWDGLGDTEVFLRRIAVPQPLEPATLTPDRLIDATEAAQASYTLGRLQAGATAVVTFSDGVHPDVVSGVLTAGGTYFADLSGLNDGPITSRVTVSDGLGNEVTSDGRPATLNTSAHLTLTLAEWQRFGPEQTANGGFDSVTVLLNNPRTTALLAAGDIAAMGADGVTDVDAPSDRLVLSVAQYEAFVAAGIALAAADHVVLRDEVDAILAVIDDGLAAAGVDQIDARDNALGLTVAQFAALDVALTAGDVVTLADTGAALAGLTPATLAGLSGALVDALDATDDSLTLSVAQVQALGSVKLAAADTVTLADDAAALAALTPLELRALSGIDWIDSTDGSLGLDLAQFKALGRAVFVGDDALSVAGTAGNDLFVFARQTFTGNDGVDGGGGHDRVRLDGDTTLAFGAEGLLGIETIDLAAGHGYVLTLADGNVAAGTTLAIDATGLGAGDSLAFDGAAESDGGFRFLGGAATASFTGGTRGDLVLLGAGAETLRYTAAAQSTGYAFDRITGFDAALDRFEVGTPLTLDAPVTSGVVANGPSFDATLALALGELQAGHGVLFTPDAGDLAGSTFLVLNVDGTTGYQGGADLVIRMTGLSGSLSSANFV